MTRGYINSLSFPASSMAAALDLLKGLRAGIGSLVKERVIDKTVMGSWRVDALPLTEAHDTLRQAAKRDDGRFRDTILFFLQLLDQRSPVTAALSDEDRDEVSPHTVDGLGPNIDEAASAAFVACALDHGVMLSLGSTPQWSADTIGFSLMAGQGDDERTAVVDNVCDAGTAASVGLRLKEAQSRYVFANWDHLTGGALRSEQVDIWLDDCRRRPGLEQLIMRTVHLAHQADYRPDGEMIKKLAGADGALFEIRIYHAGTNNVRILFARDDEGRAVYGYGGVKTAGNTWYKTAIPQAESHIATLTRR